jgi:hypothetical protein
VNERFVQEIKAHFDLQDPARKTRAAQETRTARRRQRPRRYQQSRADASGNLSNTEHFFLCTGEPPHKAIRLADQFVSPPLGVGKGLLGGACRAKTRFTPTEWGEERRAATACHGRHSGVGAGEGRRAAGPSA